MIEFRSGKPDEWRDALQRHLLACAVVDREPFEGHALIGNLRGMRVAELRVDAAQLERRADQISPRDVDCVKLLFQLSGRSRVSQGPYAATLEPGTWTVFDPERPYHIETSRGTRVLLVLVPHAQCPGWLPAVHALVARALPPSGARNIALAALTAMLRNTAPLDAHSEASLHELIVALIDRALSLELAARGLEGFAERAIGLPQLHAYIHEHLGDPALTIARIAAAFGISRRSLYNLFQPSGVTPHAFILGARLERAHALLGEPAARSTAVARIAKLCGFADPAHFTRAFHARYGVAPTARRAAAV